MFPTVYNLKVSHLAQTPLNLTLLLRLNWGSPELRTSPARARLSSRSWRSKMGSMHDDDDDDEIHLYRIAHEGDDHQSQTCTLAIVVVQEAEVRPERVAVAPIRLKEHING